MSWYNKCRVGSTRARAGPRGPDPQGARPGPSARRPDRRALGARPRPRADLAEPRAGAAPPPPVAAVADVGRGARRDAADVDRLRPERTGAGARLRHRRAERAARIREHLRGLPARCAGRGAFVRAPRRGRPPHGRPRPARAGFLPAAPPRHGTARAGRPRLAGRDRDRARALPGHGDGPEHSGARAARGRRARLRGGARGSRAVARPAPAAVQRAGARRGGRRAPRTVRPRDGGRRAVAAAAPLLRRRARPPGLRRRRPAHPHGRRGRALPARLTGRVRRCRREPLARAPPGPGGGRALRMILELDPRSPLAPYEQLRQQITALVLADGLEPGDRLPSIRQLANDLGLAGGTVARAYRELESDGVVTTHGRHGTIVQRPPERTGPPPALLEAARSFADRAAGTGASLDDALAAVRVAFAAARTA